MSTTGNQPAIGSAEWARALPPSISTLGDAKFSRTHVWTDDQGVTQALISFGAVDLTFHSPESLRAAIGHLAALAGEMDAEVARQQASEGEPADPPDPAAGCFECGQLDTPTVIGDDGEPRCYNRQKCATRAAARDAEAAKAGTR